MNKRVQTVVAGVLVAAGCVLSACEKKGSGEQGAASGNASAPVKPAETASGAANGASTASNGAVPAAGGGAKTDAAKPAEGAKDGAMASGEPVALRAGGLTFMIPATWQSKPPSSQMRLAEARVPGAAADGSQDCAVAWFQFGGSVEDNMTRWKGMVTKADGSPAEPKVEVLEVQGVKVHTVELVGQYTEGSMMGPGTKRDNWMFRGAIIETPGQLNFVRMTGPAEQMAGQQGAWVDVLKSMK